MGSIDGVMVVLVASFSRKYPPSTSYSPPPVVVVRVLFFSSSPIQLNQPPHNFSIQFFVFQHHCSTQQHQPQRDLYLHLKSSNKLWNSITELNDHFGHHRPLQKPNVCQGSGSVINPSLLSSNWSINHRCPEDIYHSLLKPNLLDRIVEHIECTE